MAGEVNPALPTTLAVARARAMRGSLARWARSLRREPAEAGPFAVCEPWVTTAAVQWLEEVVTPDVRLFEFGAGRSTVFFAERAGEVVSAEHHAEWHARVEAELVARGLANARVVLALPDGAARRRGRYTARRRDGKGLRFESYVKTIDNQPDGSLDLVFVDGRARVACVRRAISKVKAGGYLVLDDAWRRDYRPARRLLSRYPRLDFPGPVSRVPWIGLTSAWRIGQA
jgi:hypothetical protein